MITVAEFIEILKRAPQDAIVMGEFEGSIGPLESDEIRIGEASVIEHPYTDGGTFTVWSMGRHDGKNLLPGERVIRVVKVLLPSVGQSDSQYPLRVEGES